MWERQKGRTDSSRGYHTTLQLLPGTSGREKVCARTLAANVDCLCREIMSPAPELSGFKTENIAGGNQRREKRERRKRRDGRATRSRRASADQADSPAHVACAGGHFGPPDPESIVLSGCIVPNYSPQFIQCQSMSISARRSRSPP